MMHGSTKIKFTPESNLMNTKSH